MKHFLILCLATIAFSGCQVPQSTRIYSAAAPNEPVLISNFKHTYPVRDVRGAVLNSLHSRGWTVRSTTETYVDAFMEHRGFESNIRVQFAASGITIYSDSWRIDRQGERLNPEHPDGWLRNIERDVRRGLGMRF